MKKNILFLIAAFYLFTGAAVAQKPAEKEYKYTTVLGDPLKARIYKLDNGLTVYMSVYKDAPRVQTFIAVRAGSKHDPADATGLAHYLEHMVFKGTDKVGTLDFAKEQALIQQVEDLYEIYRKTTNENERSRLFRQIDSLSYEASKYAIPSEYDKMLTSIGAKGTNAYTWVEQTVYVNDIPSNQIEKWLTIEAERFRKPVLRLFHTELEAVYEEKNRTLDSDSRKVWYTLFENIFPTHTYGTQTTIGTIEHLKNPSMKEINKYYQTYYVPNNMAIALSGDFDPDKVIKMIDEKFGYMQPKPFPEFKPAVEKPITKPVIKEVYGPDAETMTMGFRFSGAGTPEADMITLISKLLYNGRAGLIDINLIQAQKVLSAYAYPNIMKDYSVHVFAGDPKENQTLDEVRNLLISQIEKVKKGEFEEWMLQAIVNDIKLQEMKQLESNSARASMFVSSFITGVPWQHQISQTERLSKITKQQIMDFAKKHYGENYVAVYKRTGADTTVQKVAKPQITPVVLNKDTTSAFVSTVLKTPAAEMQPVFLNYQKDIKHLKLNNNVPVLYLQNKENSLFNLYYIVEMGTNHNKKLGVAIEYLPYLGTSKYTPAQIKEEFFKLGCSFGVFNSDEQVYVSLNGLDENLEEALKLFEHLLSDAQPNPEALQNLVSDILKTRADVKLNKDEILWSGLFNYAVYGPSSPFTHILSEKELKELKPEELVSIIKELTSYQHKVLYYGPSAPENLTAILNRNHRTPAELKPVPEPKSFIRLDHNQNQVYVIDYDMKQAEIVFLSKSEQYDKANAPVIALFNAYFRDQAFKDLRESKALAYSAFGSYNTPERADEPYYMMGYIGSQADKLPEAARNLNNLFNELPLSEQDFEAEKTAMLERIRTERITKNNILFNYERARKLGVDYDIRQDIYKKGATLTLADIKNFQQQKIKDKNYAILVIGKKDNLDIGSLEKIGKVKFLTLEEVFGY